MAYNHDSNLREKGNLTLSRIQPGDLVTIPYESSSGRYSRNVFVLWPEDDNGNLHGLDISKLTEKEIVRLYARAQKLYSSGGSGMLAAAFPRLLVPNISDRDFYEKAYKGLNASKNPYRTYKTDDILDGLITKLEFRTDLEGPIERYA
jgi:hypothetical protein